MLHVEWVKNKAIFLALLTIFLVSQHFVSADITGRVYDPDGEILEAKVLVFDNNQLITSASSSVDGFNILLPPADYLLIVTADNPDTEGFDYLPYAINATDEHDYDIHLEYAATLRLSGEFQYVDTENLPLNNIYTVEINNETLVPSGFPLVFRDKKGSVYNIPDLQDGDIIIPIDSVVDVNISTSILIGSEIEQRSIKINDLVTPGKGEIVLVDVRQYTLPYNLLITVESRDDLNQKLVEMNKYGFYLAKQETALGTGVEYLDDSILQFEAREYDSSFGSMKRGYILFEHTWVELDNMYLDARFSVYLLIAFLTVSSIITGYLLFDEIVRQIITDIILLGSCLVFFYYTYPGSRTIPISRFIAIAILYLVGFLAAGISFPRLFRSSGTGGRVQTRNLIAPIFNLARRSLRRRRIRFLLTFISITLLVMSFVTLTSFSEGYGLITGEAAPKSGWTGVYIREASWTQNDPSFIINDDTELDWLLNQPETKQISLKAENTPLNYPIVNILGEPITGVIGVDPVENIFLEVSSTLISGEMPSGKEVLIGETVANNNQLSTGQTLTIGPNQYTVSGIFDEQKLKDLRDLDGAPYVPDKWVNTNPDGEVPNYVLKESQPNEVIIMSLEASLQIPLVGIQRIGFTINPEYNATGFAERLALERGYLAWANTYESYTSYRLGNYFQGKGATLVIPWVIVVLNVVVTMLNSLYERRKEIEILSSVGLNPAQVSSIFVAEAAITGFIAGGLGYLIGLGFYKVLALLNIGLQVHQKVSAVWSFAAIGLAISAVVTGALAALRNSVIITPSLMRRWKIDRRQGGFQDPWSIDVPIKLDPGEVDVFLDYVEMQLMSLMDHHTRVTSSIKRRTEGNTHIIDFIYKSVQTTTGNFYTRNSLKVTPTDNNEYGAQLESLGEPEWVHVAGSLIRRISMDYSTEKKG